MEKVMLVMAVPALVFFAYMIMKGRMQRAIDDTFED